MKIYTKQGDQGLSVLFDGTRVPKHHLRLETYGTLDELNSSLGLTISQCPHPQLKEQLQLLQNSIFILSSDLATPLGSPNESKVQRVGLNYIQWLEDQIDAATAQLPVLKQFILPGGGVTAAHLHITRTICRRAERHLTSLMTTTSVGPHPIIFVNRLSDLLFTLARFANHLDGIHDVEWKSDDSATNNPVER